jgi:hypothetical protein
VSAQQPSEEDAVLVVAVEDAARVAEFARSLVRGGRVMVIGLEPQPGRARTAPYVELGGTGGLVTSDGTRRDGLVALEDVRATILSVNGKDPGQGTPVRVEAAEDPIGAVSVLDRQVAALVTARTFAIPAAVGAGFFAALAALFALRRREGPGSLGTVARALVLLALAVPSGYLVASRAAPPSGPVWLALGLLVAVLLAVAAGRAGRAAPAVLGAVLLGLVTLDLAGGGEGLSRPLLGGSAYDGERFYGLGNGYFAYFLTAAALVVAFLPVRRAVAVALFAGVALVDGLPALGADVGGALTAMLTAAAAWVLLAPERVRLGRVALVVAGALAAGLVLALGVGFLTGDATHASRFADEVAGGGPAVALRVFAHKLEVNAALLATNPFAWAGPIGVALATVLALRGSGWTLRPARAKEKAPEAGENPKAPAAELGTPRAGEAGAEAPGGDPAGRAGAPGGELTGQEPAAPAGAVSAARGPVAAPPASASPGGTAPPEGAEPPDWPPSAWPPGEGPWATAPAAATPAAPGPAAPGGQPPTVPAAPTPAPGLLSGARGERVRRGVLVGVAGSVALIALNDTGVTAAAGSGMFLVLALAWGALTPTRRSGRLGVG